MSSWISFDLVVGGIRPVGIGWNLMHTVSCWRCLMGMRLLSPISVEADLLLHMGGFTMIPIIYMLDIVNESLGGAQ